MISNTVLYILKFAKWVDLMLNALTTKGKSKNKTKEMGNFWK